MKKTKKKMRRGGGVGGGQLEFFGPALHCSRVKLRVPDLDILISKYSSQTTLGATLGCKSPPVYCCDEERKKLWDYPIQPNIKEDPNETVDLEQSFSFYIQSLLSFNHRRLHTYSKV